jgi:hypothetical protein
LKVTCDASPLLEADSTGGPFSGTKNMHENERIRLISDLNLKVSSKYGIL